MVAIQPKASVTAVRTQRSADAVGPYPFTVLIVAYVLFLFAIVVAVVAVAGLTGRLPRNRWAGIRTPESLRDDATFELANRVAAPTMLASAVVLALGGVGAIVLGTIPGIAAAVVALVAALVIAGIGGSIATRAAAALEPAGACGQSCGGCSLKDSCEQS